MPSPIQIKRADVVENARALAALTGLSITDAVAQAVRDRLAMERIAKDATLAERRRKLDELVAEVRRLPRVGPPLTDDDLYDADGLPK